MKHWSPLLPTQDSSLQFTDILSSPALTSETFSWREPCMSDFYFPSIPLIKSSLNLTHFSWLCHRAPPSRTSFSFCILQVLCRLLTPFTSHHIVPHISASLYLSWECLLDLFPQSHFFSCSLKFLQLLCVTDNAVQTCLLHPRYQHVGRLHQHPGHLPFTWFSFL